jgi:MFS family permease
MTTTPHPTDALRLLRREAGLIGALLPGLLLLMLNATLLNLCGREVTNGLASDRYQVIWITAGYGVAYTFGCMMTGLVAGQVGLARCFWGALVLFGLLGTLSGLMDTVEVMTPLRIAQGCFKGLALTSAMQILWKRFPGRIPLWMSVYGTIAFAGALLGAPVGGLITHYLGWRGLFLVQLPLGAATGLVAALALPDDRPAVRARPRVEVVGVVLTLGWLICILVVAAMGQYWGWLDSNEVVFWLAGFVLFFAAFLVWGAVVSAPAISTRTLGLPRYVLTLLLLDVYGINLYVVLSLVSGYLTDQRGYQWWQGSLVLLPALPAMLAGVLLSGWLSRWANRKVRLFAGLAVMAAGVWWLSSVDLYSDGGWVAMVLVVWGLGVGVATAPAMAGLFDGLAPGQVFLQTGIFNLNRFAPASVMVLLFAALLARGTDAQFDRLRTAVTHNRPAVSEAVRHVEGDLHAHTGLTNGSAAQARAVLGKWVKANARVFALQTVLRYLAMLTAGGLVLVVVMPRRWAGTMPQADGDGVGVPALAGLRSQTA